MTLKLRLTPRPSIIARVTPRLSGATLVAGDNIDIDQVGNVYTISANVGIAAPLDALAYNGMQINGSMDVSQENGGGVVTTAASVALQYVIDGWAISHTLAAGRVNAFQQSLTTEVPGFSYALHMTPNVVQTSLNPGDYVQFANYIEGYRFARMAWGTSSAIPVTIGFWMSAAVSGTYRAIIIGSSGNSVWETFTITGGVGFQWTVITFAEVTTGIWNKTNLLGAILVIEISSPETVNLVASPSSYASITGVVVLPGTQAPIAAQSPLIMRSYDQELVTCQRYYQKREIVVDIGAVSQSIIYPVPFRSGPTISGGGAGFTVSIPTTETCLLYRNARAAQTIVFDARL